MPSIAIWRSGKRSNAVLPLALSSVASKKARSSVGRRQRFSNKGDALGGPFTRDGGFDRKKSCDHFDRLCAAAGDLVSTRNPWRRACAEQATSVNGARAPVWDRIRRIRQNSNKNSAWRSLRAATTLQQRIGARRLFGRGADP
jgi:hypothetical protein